MANLYRNTPKHGVILSRNADYAEVAEWYDGNPSNEDRIGYFVCVDTTTTGIKMNKAISTSDVRGVTMVSPGFSANASSDKYSLDGDLLPKYDYVGWAGFIPIIDNGTCTVGSRCMPSDDGTATPSSNNLGYQVIERVDTNHILILVEPSADMIQRIKSDILNIESSGTDLSEYTDAEVEALFNSVFESA